MSVGNNLLEFMNSEQLDSNLFRGMSKDFKTGQVYGGQVLGQAIRAAQNTVDDDRAIHSAHAYFLRRGDVEAPIIYEVERSRDGGRFSSRRVVANQHGKPIFQLFASFQIMEEGLEFHEQKNVRLELLERAITENKLKEPLFQSEFLEVYPLNLAGEAEPNSCQLWFKTKQAMPDDIGPHRSALAYMSDLGLLAAAVLPHGKLQFAGFKKQGFMMASIDHAIWYHRLFRADEWLFYDCKVKSTSGGRGFSHGKIYNKEGVLIASTSQEGLLRKIKSTK